MKNKLYIFLLFAFSIIPAYSATTPWWLRPTVCRINPTNCYTNMTYGYFIEMGKNIPEEVKNMEVPKPFVKKTLEWLIAQVFKRYKTTETSVMLDKLKDLGFKYSTVAGIQRIFV